MRVLIVEDHVVLSRTLSVALGAEGFEVEVAAELSPEIVLAEAGRFGPDVVVLDIDLGSTGREGIALIAPLKELGARVVVLSGAPEDAVLGDAVHAGAHGVLRKREPYERLVSAVKAAAEGRPVTAGAAPADLLEKRGRRRRERHHHELLFGSLTVREAEVLKALCEGRPAEAIAAEQEVAVSTIRSHLKSIRQKLGVSSQLEAVALANRVGWPWD